MTRCVTEVFARVTGFFRPVSDWNPGKGIKGEFSERKKYDLKKAEVDIPKVLRPL